MEAVAVGEAIEKAYRPVAEEKQKASTSKAGKASAEKRRNARGTSPSVAQDESARTTAVAAAAGGVDRRTPRVAATCRNSPPHAFFVREGPGGIWSPFPAPRDSSRS